MSPYQIDYLLVWTLRIFSILASVILLLILIFLFSESIPAIKNIGISKFFSDQSWHPTEGQFNLVPMLVATLLIMAGSVIIATPLGILSAVFCNYYAPTTLSTIYRRIIEILAGIPSVVYGFWGLVVIVPIIVEIEPPGPSIIAAILILSIMILPTVALLADSSFRNVPDQYIHGASALGLSRSMTIFNVIIPSAKSGLVTGVILQSGRAIGETMAVLMVCGNIVQIPSSVFDPVRTLTANIALEMAYATGDHRSSLFVSGLILALIVIILLIIAEYTKRGSVYE